MLYCVWIVDLPPWLSLYHETQLSQIGLVLELSPTAIVLQSKELQSACEANLQIDCELLFYHGEI